MGLTMENLQKQINQLKKELAELKNENPVSIKNKLEIGDTFDLIGLKWKIMDKTGAGYMCLAETLEDKKQFDKNNSDWKKSSLREYLNGEFLEKLSDAVGEENIISFERDLFSLDGQTEYGSCEDKVSLLTVDEYRKYRSMIPNTDDGWWWLITPCNSPSDIPVVSVVVRSDVVSYDRYSQLQGVHPVCILSPSVFTVGE